MSRQSAGLGTNTNVETDPVQIVESHSTALKAAMLHAENEKMGRNFQIPMVSYLCSWHALLCPNHRESGRFRSRQARAGDTLFCPSQDLESEMESFGLAMQQLYDKWSSQILVGSSPTFSTGPHREDSLILSTYYSVALAAIMLYGLLDIHLFADGNGRLARICTNWVLRRLLGLPFTITIAATPSQRSEYIKSLRSSLRWIMSLQDADPSNPDFPLSVTQARASSSQQQHQQQQHPHIEFGIFEDLIHVLLDRIAHACNECQRTIVEKTQSAIANEEARIARVVRERAATGQCVICLEENPDILTICCGQATHLNCLAEWLATATNCVACRKPLPALSLRQRNPDGDATMDDHEGDNEAINSSANPRNDLWNAILTNMLWEAAGSNDESHCENQECNNRAASDCPNFMCRLCCQSYGTMECMRHDDPPQDGGGSYDGTSTHSGPELGPVEEESDPVETTTVTDPSSSPRPNLPRCRRCNNRAALDCGNQMCSRHCVLHGWYTCRRHNTSR